MPCQPFFRERQTQQLYSQPCQPVLHYDPTAEASVGDRLYHFCEPEFDRDTRWENVHWVFWDVHESSARRNFSFAVVFWLEDEVFWNKPRPSERELLGMARGQIYEYLSAYRCPERRSQTDTIIRLGNQRLIDGLRELGPLPIRKK